VGELVLGSAGDGGGDDAPGTGEDETQGVRFFRTERGAAPRGKVAATPPYEPTGLPGASRSHAARVTDGPIPGFGMREYLDRLARATVIQNARLRGRISFRRFKSEVQQCSIDDMAE
jgi:hypothetical protein